MSVPFNASDHPHRRFNPLAQTWVLCSPHRMKRPWQGAVEPPQIDNRPQYDPKCYLCPGNERAGGIQTEKYEGTFIFENDFAALIETDVANPPKESEEAAIDSLFQSESTRGKCFVICFSPRHDITIAEMSDDEMIGVIAAWRKLYVEAPSKYPWLKYMQIFENKGAINGCSNPHPHGQAWALSTIPTLPTTILESQREYAHAHKTLPGIPTLTNGLPCLLLNYAHTELTKFQSDPECSRVVIVGKHFLGLVPYWASWPFEMMILPFNRHISSLAQLNEEESRDLAHTIGAVARRMDNLFECSFGYSLGIYQTPIHRTAEATTGQNELNWADYAQLHFGFYPPLLRSSTVRKFLVGFELFAETQRDLTPEAAAKRLRECSDVHYKQRLQ